MFDGMPAGVHSSLCEVLVSQPDSLDIMEKTSQKWQFALTAVIKLVEWAPVSILCSLHGVSSVRSYCVLSQCFHFWSLVPNKGPM